MSVTLVAIGTCCGAVFGAATMAIRQLMKRPKHRHLWDTTKRFNVSRREMKMGGQAWDVEDTIVVQVCSTCHGSRRVWKSELPKEIE